MFKIGRIIALSSSEETFSEELLKDLPPLESNMTPSSYVQLKLRVSQRLAFRVYDEFDRKGVVPQADGSFLIEVEFPVDAWVLGYLFTFGADVEIIEPSWLRKELSYYAKKIFEHHKP